MKENEHKYSKLFIDNLFSFIYTLYATTVGEYFRTPFLTQLRIIPLYHQVYQNTRIVYTLYT